MAAKSALVIPVGANRSHYTGLYKAKGMGKMHEHIAKHGNLPSRGGSSWHGALAGQGKARAPRKGKNKSKGGRTPTERAEVPAELNAL